MKHFICLTAAIAGCMALLSLSSCKEDPLVTTGSIMGVVTDADTKQPLGGVSVSIEPGGSAKLSGNDGAYSFSELEAQEYTLTFTKDDYNPATAKLTVKQNVNNNKDVALEPIKPLLKVSTEKLEFGTELSVLPLDISNDGKGSLSWEISHDPSWFSCSPISGTTVKDITPVVVSVSRDGKERGNYTQVFTILSNGGSKVITVSMEVGGVALAFAPQTLDFGSLASSLQLTLTNGGAGNISYTVEKSGSWISLSKTSGTITQSDYIAVSVSRETLSTGSHTGTITIKSGVERFVIPVTIEVSEVALGIEPQTLDFGSLTSSLQLAFTNHGTGNISYTVETPNEWISLSKASGIITQNDYVNVTVSREALSLGNYTGAITIKSGTESFVVPVIMEVGGIALEVDPQTLNFGSLTSSLQLTLTNGGSGNISYTVETSNAWVSLSKTSGTITQSDYISVVVSRESLSAGNYTGTITIKSGIESFVIPVVMEIAVEEQPVTGFEQIRSIAYNSAVFGGTMLSVGSSKVTRYGFCWSTQPAPTVDDSKTNLGDCTNPLAFESTATNLQHSTKYYVRAYAENSVGLSYSSERSFTTTDLPTVPGVITGSVSGITASTATVGGTLSSLGNEAEVMQHGHVWSLTANPTVDLTTRTSLGALGVTGQYSSSLAGLLPGKEYHVRAYATNSKGTAYGDDVTFTTATADATLTTSAATDIVHNAATCGGSITSDGGHTIVEQGVCWATTSSPTVDNHTVVSSSSGSAFTCRITDLATTATYHVRAYIKTQSGAVYYGENRTFTTTQVVSLPEVAVTTVSAIRTDRVTFQSSVTSDGNSAITDYGFVYATWQNPTVDAAEKLSAGAGNASFGKTALELAEGTTYYVRAYATNAMGTAYGDETSFSTLAVTAPTLAAVSVSGVGISDATLTGSVTDNGNAAITEAGFCWSENPYPTTSDNKISCGTGTALSAGLSNLNDGITYYVRAYAINSKGTGYSADATFTTITLPTNVIFVSSQGNDSNDGRSWSKAKKTIGAAMTAANVGEQVWVTNATFQESVTLKEGVDLYGGFAGTEISILQKSSSGKTTLLGGRIVQSNNFSTPVNVDGFTISTVSTNIVFNGGIVLNNFVINNCNATISIMNCTMSNSTITNNSNAIKLSNCTIENSTISNNANYAISLVSTTISNSILSNNVYISSGENSELNTCIISNNSSYGLFFTTGNLINCKIQNNKGFGILLAGEGNLVGCLITGNGALSRSQNGNGFYAYGVRIQASSNERVNIYNCTINNNITQSNSCGNYCSNHQEVDIVSAGTVYIVNSIIYPNVPRSGGSHISVTGTANNFYVSNTLSANEFTMGQGNIRITNKADYKLDANSYAPQSDSPAINAGDNSFVETTKDVNGNTRIQGGTVDIGAVESSY